MAGDSWVRVAAVGDVAAGEMIALEVGGRNVALYHLEDDAWHATDNICTHAYALLTDGWLEDNEVECPLHAGRFDVRTGAATCSPASEKLAVFPVKIEGDDVLLRLE
jgi:nitrite reductase/ring-hydroxylating ferredoxin subunit